MLEVQHLSRESLQELQQDMARLGHQAKIIIVSGGSLYLIDGHHHALAIYMKDKQANTTCSVGENNRNLTPSDPNFWNTMARQNYARLLDENGRPGIPPSTLGGLKDDKYRTVAGWVKDWLDDKCSIRVLGDYTQFQ